MDCGAKYAAKSGKQSPSTRRGQPPQNARKPASHENKRANSRNRIYKKSHPPGTAAAKHPKPRQSQMQAGNPRNRIREKSRPPGTASAAP
jgi:hypothetical protein